jgi:hypothetical protein
MGNFPFEGRREVSCHRHQWTLGEPILKVEIGLIEGPSHSDQQPTAIGRHTDAGPVLLLSRLIDQSILDRVSAEPVEIHGAVIMLLLLRHFTGRGISGVVESGRVG